MKHEYSARYFCEKEGLWGLMRPVIGKIYYAIGLGALSSFLSLSAMAGLGYVIYALLNPPANPWWAVFGVVVLTILSLSFRLYAFTVSHLAAFRLEVDLRTTLSAHLALVPLGYLLSMGSGALSKVQQDNVADLHAFVADTTPSIGQIVAAPIITFLLLLAIDWRLALVTFLVLALGIIVLSFAMKDSSALTLRYEQAKEDINNSVIEYVQAMPVVRTFDSGTSSFRRYQTALESYRQVYIDWMAIFQKSGKMAIIILSPLPTIFILLIAGVFLYQSGNVSFSAWMATLVIGSGMVECFMPLMWLQHFLRKSKTSAARIQDILREPELTSPTTHSQTPERYDIVFDKVDFSYGSRQAKALEEISFTVAQGTVTALVGPSGAGKSTVAKLIPRFWDVDQGAITIGGIDIRQMSPETLMSTVSFVFQDNFLFHDSIFNNISLGIDNASVEDVEAAAKAAQAHDFILQLPQGYQTKAGDRGGRLSGGQRQRITIAKAILQNRPIIVLDEATAFADPENEAALVSALANLIRGRTVIVIAHRLSTISQVDQIIVFDRGRVIEKGTHDTLLANQNLYAKMWQHYEQALCWSLGKHVNKGDVQ